jgi:hypothetical protein
VTAILVIFGPLVFLMICTIAQSAKRAARAAGDPRAEDEMANRDPIFRYHNCAVCNDGAQPCLRDNPSRCEFPHARND